MSNEIEIGRGKRARRVYTFDEIGIVPTRRTRDPELVSTAWTIDAFQFDIPVLGAPMDSVMSPATAIELGRLGGLGVLNLEGLWTRHENPEPLLEELASITDEVAAVKRMRELYAAPIQSELIRARLGEIRDAGVTVAGALSPHRTAEFTDTVVGAGVDLFVIRGNTVSAEHVAQEGREPLNLKQFIYELDVPVIVGVLVGFGGGASSTTRVTLGIRAPMASAIADVAGARSDYLDESGGRYVHVIADGGLGSSGDLIKAMACGADAVMLGTALARASDAPGKGWHWGQEAHHEDLPRGRRVDVEPVAPLSEIVNGPAHVADGSANLMGALRRAMATTGYSELKSFQRIDIVHAER